MNILKKSVGPYPLGIWIAFVVLFARLFYLQVIEGDAFRRLSESNSIRLQNIDSPRGLIFDRKGKLLVDNRPSFDLRVIVKDAKPIVHTMEKLSGYVKISKKRRLGIAPQSKKYRVGELEWKRRLRRILENVYES